VNALKASDKAKERRSASSTTPSARAARRTRACRRRRSPTQLGKVADEIGTENIPAAVQSRLKEFGLLGAKQTKLLTVNEADKLNRLLNNNNPGNGPGSLAMGGSSRR
jgi:hypothetical protein